MSSSPLRKFLGKFLWLVLLLLLAVGIIAIILGDKYGIAWISEIGISLCPVAILSFLYEIILRNEFDDIRGKQLSEIKKEIWSLKDLKDLQKRNNEKLNDLESLLNEIYSSNNPYINRYTTIRLDRELELFRSLRHGTLTLTSQKNYEYIRAIFKSIIQKIMSDGDIYITLSSLGFWTSQPFLTYKNKSQGRKEFMEINYDAALNHNKHIIRVIAIDKKLLTTLDKNLDPEGYESQEHLKELVNDFHDPSNHFNHLNTHIIKGSLLNFFYLIDEKNLQSYIGYLATAMFMSKDRITFVKTNKILGDLDNGNVNFGYYEFKKEFDLSNARLTSFEECKKLIHQLFKTRDDIQSLISSTNNSAFDHATFLRKYAEIFSGEVQGSELKSIDEMHAILKKL